MDDLSVPLKWIIFILASGAAGYIAYRLKKGDNAEKELIKRSYEYDKKNNDESNANLTDQQLADKNNSRK